MLDFLVSIQTLLGIGRRLTRHRTAPYLAVGEVHLQLQHRGKLLLHDVCLAHLLVEGAEGHGHHLDQALHDQGVDEVDVVLPVREARGNLELSVGVLQQLMELLPSFSNGCAPAALN